VSPRSVQDLDVWRDAIALVKETYAATRGWPRDEIYGLTSQVRRASVSIPANLAEGRGRGTPGEVRRFAQIAIGSAYELDTLLLIVGELSYPVPEGARDRIAVLIRRIQSFIRFQQSKAG